MIHYSESGTGNPIILIHGYCEDSRVWNSLSDSLSSEFRILCPDLPGFGKSDRLEETSIEHVADEIAKWLDGLGINECLMIGHSLGGYVTLAFAEKYPERLSGYGLFNSTATADSEEKKKTRAAVEAFVNNYGAPRFIESLVPALFRAEFQKSDYAQYREFVKIALDSDKHAIIDYAYAMRDRADRQSVLQQGSLPVLFIAGQEDNVVPLDVSKAQAENKEGISFHILEDTAHMGMYEEPEKSAELIRSFAHSIL